MPRPHLGGSGLPQLAFSAAIVRTASALGCTTWALRYRNGSCLAVYASSSMKLSTTNTLWVSPTPRQNAVVTAGGSTRTYSTCRLGQAYGVSAAQSITSNSIPSLNRVG